jgi:HSP20 family molecular chaperone IbpA
MTNETKESGEVARPETTYQQTFVPRIDIWEGEDELVLYADMPGVKPDNIDIRFENRELTIRGQICPRYNDVQLLYGEYSIGDFHRTFAIGEAIDAEKISAEMSDGVLTLYLPKSVKVKPRRIQVKAK